jgi:hypothetical protein
MVTFRAPFDYWSGRTFAELANLSFDHLGEPSHCLTLSASIVLAPVTDNSPRQNHIITPQFKAFAKQFAYLYELVDTLALLKKIEYATGSDLDDIWGAVYELRRKYGEDDDKYRKRLQVYLLQLAGSGTKSSIEEIVSIVCGVPDCCRVDTYGGGFCRIYITNYYARKNAIDRLNLINELLPDTLAAGIDYRFYIPYAPLSAEMLLQGPVNKTLLADEALQGTTKRILLASIFLASRHDESLQASMVLAITNLNRLQASEALRAEVKAPLNADIVLQAEKITHLTADEALQGRVDMTFKAYERLQADVRNGLQADIALQGVRLRPLIARIRLEAA